MFRIFPRNCIHVPYAICIPKRRSYRGMRKMYLYFEVSLTLIFGFGRSNLGLQSSSKALWAICELKERMPILKKYNNGQNSNKKLRFLHFFGTK